MRFVAFSLLAFLTVQSSAAMAANVLLPSNSTASKSTLGLTPQAGQQQISPAVPQSAPQQQAAPVTSEQAPASTAMPAGSSSDEGLTEAQMQKMKDDAINAVKAKLATPNKPIKSEITPGGQVSKEALTQQEALANKLLSIGVNPTKQSAPLSPAEVTLQKFVETQKAKYNRSPTIMDELPIPDLSSLPLPGSLRVAIDQNYIWGADDAKAIKRALGYDAQTIPQYCQIRLDLTASTDEDAYTFRTNIFPAGSETLKFKGNLVSVKVQPRAICNPPTVLPLNGGIIMRSGNKLSVQLTAGSGCAVPANLARLPSGLQIQYAGNGTTNCRFQ